MKQIISIVLFVACACSCANIRSNKIDNGQRSLLIGKWTMTYIEFADGRSLVTPLNGPSFEIWLEAEGTSALVYPANEPLEGTWAYFHPNKFVMSFEFEPGSEGYERATRSKLNRKYSANGNALLVKEYEILEVKETKLRTKVHGEYNNAVWKKSE